MSPLFGQGDAMTQTVQTLLVSGFLLSRLIVAAAVILAAGVTIIASKR